MATTCLYAMQMCCHEQKQVILSIKYNFFLFFKFIKSLSKINRLPNTHILVETLLDRELFLHIWFCNTLRETLSFNLLLQKTKGQSLLFFKISITYALIIIWTWWYSTHVVFFLTISFSRKKKNNFFTRHYVGVFTYFEVFMAYENKHKNAIANDFILFLQWNHQIVWISI